MHYLRKKRPATLSRATAASLRVAIMESVHAIVI